MDYADLMKKDPISGITFDEYIQRNGMTLEEAKECFDKAAFIQNRYKQSKIKISHSANHTKLTP